MTLIYTHNDVSNICIIGLLVYRFGMFILHVVVCFCLNKRGIQ